MKAGSGVASKALPNLERYALIAVALTLSCSHGVHGLRDPHPHAPRDIGTYIARLENPKRVEALAVASVLEALALERSDTVADIGCGPGVFSIPLSRVVSSGVVYAVDVEPKQLDALRARASAASLSNLVPVLASFDDPFLPEGKVDLALVVDTYHHIEERVGYFERLQRSLTADGRLAIVEWKPGDFGMGPPPDRKLAEGVRERELLAAGYELVERFDFHEFHDFEIWKPTGTSAM